MRVGGGVLFYIRAKKIKNKTKQGFREGKVGGGAETRKEGLRRRD